MMRYLFLCLIAAPGALATHPCEQSIKAACPEVVNTALCLMEPAQHATPTHLTKECLGFVAVNRACADDIEKHCDEIGKFADETTSCLKEFEADLDRNCKGTSSWYNEEEVDAVDKDLAQTQGDLARTMDEYQKNTLEVHMAAVDLEIFKREQPEEYAAQLEREKETERQAAAQKKRERAIQAALERKKRADAGLSEEEEDEQPKPKKEKKAKKEEPPAAKPQGYFQGLMAFLFVGGLCLGGYFLVMKMDADGQAESNKKEKKKDAKKKK